MSRIRLNTEYRNKIANRMRVHLESEDTQEKQKYDELKGQQIDLNDKAWSVAEKIVRRHYTESDVEKARYLQKKYKIKKVAIIDFDVHHGNGTQEIFYNDNSVAYASTHEFPLFPGPCAEEESGVGNIFNATLK